MVASRQVCRLANGVDRAGTEELRREGKQETKLNGAEDPCMNQERDGHDKRQKTQETQNTPRTENTK